MTEQLLIAAVLGFFVAALSFRYKFLTLSGAVAAFILALIIFGFGSWMWAVPIVTFFVTSSLLSKLGAGKKRELEQIFEKSSTRDWGQVVANGGVAGMVALFAGLFPTYDLYPLYLSALAAVTADTWGTELGVLAGGKVFSIITLRQVPVGKSGGVSGLGTLGGILGAAVVALSGYSWYADAATAAIVVLAGFSGSIADSILGATVQANYRCNVCTRETERLIHCDVACSLVRGNRWINNDAVNLFCGAVGAVVGWGMLLLVSR